MHEMSIALSIIELAEEEIKKAGAKKVNEIELEIGTLSGVEIEALEFAMEVAVINTCLEGAKVNISQVQAVAKCNNCGHTFETVNFFPLCPECSKYDNTLIKGKEMRVKSLLVDD
ncbi:MAG: hydrogenase maturation nickel metallochaperone HypA [Bacteroidota bacterium]|nr:hydrogenase maturation nickel metallochaperone HypA [Bacteroidota bacterium]